MRRFAIRAFTHIRPHVRPSVMRNPTIRLLSSTRAIPDIRSDITSGKLGVTSKRAAELLDSACMMGDTETVRVLLEHGADPNKRHWGGTTSLHAATCRQHIDIVRLLLQHGANPYALDCEEQNVLYYASVPHRLASSPALHKLLLQYTHYPGVANSEVVH